MAYIVKRGKSWRAQIRRPGFPSESRSFRTKKDAERWQRQRETELDSTTAKKVRAAKSRKVSDSLNVYFKRKCGFAMRWVNSDGVEHSLSPRKAWLRFKDQGDNAVKTGTTVKTARQIATYLQFWYDRIGNIQLGKLDSEDIQDCLEELNDGKRSLKTVNEYHRAISAALQIVVEPPRQWIQLNPASFKKHEVDNARDRILYEDEEKALHGAIKDERLRLVFLIGLATGLRQDNIMSLTWDNVTLSSGEIFIPRTKNGDAITTVVTGKALTALKEWSKVRTLGLDWVFPASRGRSYADFPRKDWYVVLKAAGIQRKRDPDADRDREPRAFWGFRFHDLRHTVGTRLMNAGASQFAISAVLGHKTAQMTKRYVRDDVDVRRAALESLLEVK